MIIYSGPSMIDGKKVIAVLTGTGKVKSQNVKTGPMAQLWILREDVKPIDAIRSGEDYSICGNCRHRDGSCYVDVSKAPNNIYKTYREGKYPAIPPRIAGRGHKIRLGAYGDPAALPINIINELISEATSWTGYTHSPGVSPGLKGIVQASADSEVEAKDLQSAGWKTFRVKVGGEVNLKREVTCFNVTKGVTCADCMLCDGHRVNVSIEVHGTKAKINKFISIKQVA